MEAYLAGGVSCFLGTHFLYGYPMGVKIDQAWVDAEGDWDLRGVFGADGPPRFSEIRLTTHIVGPESLRSTGNSSNWHSNAPRGITSSWIPSMSSPASTSLKSSCTKRRRD